MTAGLPARWAILTGEYPPQPGGVADYTALVAGALVAAGDAVTVFAPRHVAGEVVDTSGVAVVRLPDRFGPRGLLALDRALGRLRPDRVLLQYVPHAYGYKAMNLLFAAWVGARAWRVAPVWVMFHEVCVGFRWRPVTAAALGSANAVMARLVAGAATRVFVSIPAWADHLRGLCPRSAPAEWLPVPCNVSSTADPAAVEQIRAGYDGDPLVGHFGTFGGPVTDLLGPATAVVLRHTPAARLLLLGRGSEGYRDQFSSTYPDLAGRVRAAAGLSPDAVAAHLRACDLLVQPFPDGISTRRTSAMAGLANGVPVVSNLGHLSEPVWPALGCVELAPGPDPAAVAAAAERVLARPLATRAALGAKAAAVYRERFGVEHTVAKLRGDA